MRFSLRCLCVVLPIMAVACSHGKTTGEVRRTAGLETAEQTDDAQKIGDRCLREAADEFEECGEVCQQMVRRCQGSDNLTCNLRFCLALCKVSKAEADEECAKKSAIGSAADH